MYIDHLCESLFESIETPSDEFQTRLQSIFCKLDCYSKDPNHDEAKIVKSIREVRGILAVLRLLPVEYKLAMQFHHSYEKTLCGFLSIYLDLQLIQMKKFEQPDTFLQKVLNEVFLVFNTEDYCNIWSVALTSNVIQQVKPLEELILKSINSVCSLKHTFDQYVRMIWLLHAYFRRIRESDSSEGTKWKRDEIVRKILKMKLPDNLMRHMCHRFPKSNWQNKKDHEIHHSLVDEPQERDFFKQLCKYLHSTHTFKYDSDVELIDYNSDESEADVFVDASSTLDTDPKKSLVNGKFGSSVDKNSDSKKPPTPTKSHVKKHKSSTTVIEVSAEKEQNAGKNSTDEDEGTEVSADELHQQLVMSSNVAVNSNESTIIDGQSEQDYGEETDAEPQKDAFYDELTDDDAENLFETANPKKIATEDEPQETKSDDDKTEDGDDPAKNEDVDTDVETAKLNDAPSSVETMVDDENETVKISEKEKKTEDVNSNDSSSEQSSQHVTVDITEDKVVLKQRNGRGRKRKVAIEKTTDSESSAPVKMKGRGGGKRRVDGSNEENVPEEFTPCVELYDIADDSTLCERYNIVIKTKAKRVRKRRAY